MVVEAGRDGVEPNDALPRVDVDEAEPVVLLDACSFADTQRSVREHSNAIPAKNKHASEAGKGPGVWRRVEWSLVDACGSDGEQFHVGREVREDVTLVVVGEGGDGCGGRVWVWSLVGHVDRKS